jgi:hypothetical protein
MTLDFDRVKSQLVNKEMPLLTTAVIPSNSDRDAATCAHFLLPVNSTSTRRVRSYARGSKSFTAIVPHAWSATVTVTSTKPKRHNQ